MGDVTVPTTASRCLCGRLPTVTKGRGGWILACPAWRTCKHAPNGGRYATLPQAVDGWNFIIEFLRKKEAANNADTTGKGNRAKARRTG